MFHLNYFAMEIWTLKNNNNGNNNNKVEIEDDFY